MAIKLRLRNPVLDYYRNLLLSQSLSSSALQYSQHYTILPEAALIRISSTCLPSEEPNVDL